MFLSCLQFELVASIALFLLKEHIPVLDIFLRVDELMGGAI